MDCDFFGLIVVVVTGSGNTMSVFTTGVSNVTGICGSTLNTPARSLRPTAPTTLNVTSSAPSASSSMASTPAWANVSPMRCGDC